MKVYIEKNTYIHSISRNKKIWARVYTEFIRAILFEEWKTKGLGNKERPSCIESHSFKRKVKYKDFMTAKIC